MKNPKENREIRLALKNFIRENFLVFSGSEDFEDMDSLLETGIIDSTGLLELIGFIEEEFDIRVEDEEAIPDNLDSLDNLTSYIGRKLEIGGS